MYRCVGVRMLRQMHFVTPELENEVRQLGPVLAMGVDGADQHLHLPQVPAFLTITSVMFSAVTPTLCDVA